jgi:mannosyltransferase OCH1-like enzyme
MNQPQDFPNNAPLAFIEDHTLRSRLVRGLINTTNRSELHSGSEATIPRTIVQFWNNAKEIPLDVKECIDSWQSLEDSGFTHTLFDDQSAADFIRQYFGPRQVLAFEKCSHPAMRADYFRLCFMSQAGGMYVDADDLYLGEPIEHLFSDNLLKLQPLCYDIPSDSMADPITTASQEDDSKIFYVNNNPLVAPPGHTIIEDALNRATSSVLSASIEDRDIQKLTGPGNLTISLVTHATELGQKRAMKDFVLLKDWDATAISKWPLEYRADSRNWRNWVQNND